MRIVQTAKHKIAILSLVGDPLCEPDAMLLRNKIHDILDGKIKHVILDLSGVKHINSTGLGGLVSALVTMLRAGGDLTLASTGVNVRKVLKITKLAAVFTTYENVDEALKNYRL